jgi:hypothetical protein
VNTLRLQICLGFLLLLLSKSGFATSGQEAALSEQSQKMADKHRKKIKAEIGKLKDHEWAGNYYKGDGLGENVSFSIAPQSGYVFEWHGCLGLYGLNYGAAAWTNDRIHLSFQFENKPGFGGIAPEFVPVSWNSRHYLVPADDVVGFCNAVNLGGEPRMNVYGSYLLRDGDEKKSAAGFPELPVQYRPYLLEKPIEAAILKVGPFTLRPSISTWKFKDTPVTLDAGTNKGLLVGMELVVTQPPHIVKSVRLTHVQADHSEGIMDQAGEEEPGPKVGWRLSTRAPWYDVIRGQKGSR